MYHWTIKFTDGTSYNVQFISNIREAIQIALMNSSGKTDWDIVEAKARKASPKS
jgi:hypothetical protein